MHRLALISNYNGRRPSSLFGKIIRISEHVVHVQLENGRFIAFHKGDVISSDKLTFEGEEVELIVNRSVQAVL